MLYQEMNRIWIFHLSIYSKKTPPGRKMKRNGETEEGMNYNIVRKFFHRRWMDGYRGIFSFLLVSVRAGGGLKHQST